MEPASSFARDSSFARARRKRRQFRVLHCPGNGLKYHAARSWHDVRTLRGGPRGRFGALKASPTQEAINLRGGMSVNNPQSRTNLSSLTRESGTRKQPIVRHRSMLHRKVTGP